jgi:hypothetical protein
MLPDADTSVRTRELEVGVGNGTIGVEHSSGPGWHQTIDPMALDLLPCFDAAHADAQNL